MSEHDAPRPPATQGEQPAPAEQKPKTELFPQIDPIAVLGAAPTLSYLVFNAVGGARAAIAAAVIVGIVVYVVQRRLRPQITVVRWLMVFGVCFNVAFGIWGLIEEDGKVYWARDFVDNFALGAVFVISVFVGRPIVSAVVREVWPGFRDQLPPDHRVWNQLTIGWGLYIALAGVLRWWILDQVSAETYALIRLPLGWGLGAVLMIWSFAAVRRVIREAARERLREQLRKDLDDARKVVADAEVSER